MTVNYDKSYLPAGYERFVSRGCAAEDIYHLRFNFCYTDAQRDENRREHDTLPEDAWRERHRQACETNNTFMHKVMATIAQQFICYQYDKEQERKINYDSNQWDLFFWCSHWTKESGLTGRDYTYFTLGINKANTVEQNAELCKELLELLERAFGDSENLDVAIQYCLRWDEERLANDAKLAAKKLVGKRVSFYGMDGRLVESNGKVYFMKKYAKSKGCLVDDSDLIRFADELEETEALQ